jgi:hypothetical protein
MPVRHSIDLGPPLVYTTFSGHVTDADLREHLVALLADERFYPMMPELVDLTDVTDVSVTSAMVEASARWLLHSPLARRAIVAPTDVLFGLSRMYQLYRDDLSGDTLKVFRTRERALEWLNAGESAHT